MKRILPLATLIIAATIAPSAQAWDLVDDGGGTPGGCVRVAQPYEDSEAHDPVELEPSPVLILRIYVPVGLDSGDEENQYLLTEIGGQAGCAVRAIVECIIRKLQGPDPTRLPWPEDLPLPEPAWHWFPFEIQDISVCLGL